MSKHPTNDRQKISGYIAMLKRLSSDNDPSKKDRAALATLRRGVTYPETDQKILSVIGPFLPQQVHAKEFRAYPLVACLYALHEHDVDDRWASTLGAAARQLRNQLDQAKNNVGVKSLDQQFSTILDSNRHDMPLYLRHLMHRIASAAQPIQVNYRRLLDDLIWIERGSQSDRRIRRAWAYQYWVSNSYVPPDDLEESTTDNLTESSDTKSPESQS